MINKRSIDLKDFELRSKLFDNDENWVFFEVVNISTGNKNIAKISTHTFSDLSREQVIDLSREMNITSRLNHPSILKFTGYSPIDFDDNPKPVILYDYTYKDNLYSFFERKESIIPSRDAQFLHIKPIKEDQKEKDFNDTQKLIIIYGIASGMSYLHSNDIIHRDLIPLSIILDESFYPKITRFNISKEIQPNSELESKLTKDIIYLAPEVLSCFKYSKSSDVYSFSFIMYQILTGKKIDIEKIDIKEGKRPQFETPILKAYQDLIEKCWSKDPNERPTFSEILNILKTNSEIRNNIDESVFLKYINNLENTPSSFEPATKIKQIDNVLKMKNRKFERNNFDKILKDQFDPEIDLSNFQLKKPYKSTYMYKLYETVMKETGEKFTALVYFQKITNFLRYEIVNFINEVDIISQLNHPSIHKYVGYSSFDFDNQSKPVIITEFLNMTLDQLNHLQKQKMDDTQKLIIIYGIASGMSYLHSNNILHRDLKPSNIYLDSEMHPKISGFNISKEINNDKSTKNEHIKGTPTYISPEVYLHEGYHKSSDVYSFSLIMYELLTDCGYNIPDGDPNEIMKQVAIDKERPKFTKPILNAYRSLIERCWSSDPKERPTFDEIRFELKTNPEILNDLIDKEYFFEYANYLDEFPNKIYKDKKVKSLTNIIESKIHTFRDLYLDFYQGDPKKTETHDLSFNIYNIPRTEILDIENTIYDTFYRTYIVSFKNGTKRASRQPTKNVMSFYKHEVINFSRELNILMQLDHPSIIKFIGYMSSKEKLRIDTEYFSGKSLGEILESNRKDQNEVANDESDDLDGEPLFMNPNDSFSDFESNSGGSDSISKFGSSDSISKFGSSDSISKFGSSDSISKFGSSDSLSKFGGSDSLSKFGGSDSLSKFGGSDSISKFGGSDSLSKFGGSDSLSKFGLKLPGKFGNNPFSEFESENEENEENCINLNDTQKLIIIYGIASGMSYLHSNNILHRDLKPSNIYLDSEMHPKISGFNISKEINNDKSTKNEHIKGTPIYISPEVYLHEGYHKSSDVYSFSLIMYELLTGQLPYPDLNDSVQIKQKVAIEGKRPQFETPILKAYQDLIEKCWSKDPNERPTFPEILNILKTNSEIRNNVDESAFLNYINTLENTPSSFQSSKKIKNLEDFVKLKLHLFEEFDTKVNMGNVYKTETNNVLLDSGFIDLRNYKKIQHIDRYKLQFHYSFYLVREKSTGTLFKAKILSQQFNCMMMKQTYSIFLSEINSIFGLNHPSLLNIVGFSPTDFHNYSRPVIISEYASNDSLERILEIDQKIKLTPLLDHTKKLIIIYGIAFAMSYLHSHDVIHCSLKPSNIYLDDFLFPKVGDFEQSKKSSENPILNLKEEIKKGSFFGKDEYDSPEVLKYSTVSSASDVYSFGMILYQIITNEKPFLNYSNFDLIKNSIVNGMLPKMNESIPDCYKKLIKKCCLLNPIERPTFDEIIYHLKNNPEFITEEINKEEYYKYVQLVDKYTRSDEYKQVDDFIKTQNQVFRKVKINFKKMKDWSKVHFSIDIGSIDLEKFEFKEKIGEGCFGEVNKVLEKETGITYAAKICKNEIDFCDEDEKINLMREINIISQLNHPSILKFIGYNPNDLNPVIITELAPNSSLDVILKDERRGLRNHEWNDTKKLINIYGIASGMSYLHKKNILHRDLKPANILLDEFLYPKICDFGLSKYIFDPLSSYQENYRIDCDYPLKGTLIYCSPEIFNKSVYTKQGDVYAFAMIVYEIITGEEPFNDLKNGYFSLQKKLNNDERPKFNIPIPYCYRNLIEQCWSSDIRPEFDEIVDRLENDPKFITQNIDKDEYYDYIQLVKENQQNNFEKIEQKQKSVDLYKAGIIDDENEYLHKCFIDINNYEKLELLTKNDLNKVYKIRDKNSHNLLSAQISRNEIERISDEIINKLSDELTLFSKLNHPSLLKFIGFTPFNFKKERKPVIISEFISNGSLADILELERNKSNQIYMWNNTKKLINIYGIAVGMSYLHSKGIIHRSLKPSNIFLSDTLFLKIGDFGLSTRFSFLIDSTMQSISGNKDAHLYLAPEVLNYNKYSKSSDVYSFALIVYEIISNQKPFSNINSITNLFSQIEKGNRPELNDTIPEAYQVLIKKCWSQNRNERPTFDEIVYNLRNDSNFITEGVNKEDFHRFIDLFEPDEKVIIIEEETNPNEELISTVSDNKINIDLVDHEKSNQNFEEEEENAKTEK